MHLQSTLEEFCMVSFSYYLAPTDATDTLIEFVDMILKDQDYNRDGYIDYPEYISYYTKFELKDEEKK